MNSPEFNFKNETGGDIIPNLEQSVVEKEEEEKASGKTRKHAQSLSKVAATALIMSAPGITVGDISAKEAINPKTTHYEQVKHEKLHHKHEQHKSAKKNIKHPQKLDKVVSIEAHFNEKNSFLLNKIPINLKEAIIHSDKVFSPDRIDQEFDKLDFQHQENIIRFLKRKIDYEYGKGIGESTVLLSMLYHSLSENHSYKKNLEAYLQNNKRDNVAKKELVRQKESILASVQKTDNTRAKQGDIQRKNVAPKAEWRDSVKESANQETLTLDDNSKITFKFNSKHEVINIIPNYTKESEDYLNGRTLLKEGYLDILSKKLSKKVKKGQDISQHIIIARAIIETTAREVFFLKEVLGRLTEMKKENSPEANFLRKYIVQIKEKTKHKELFK